MTIKEFAEKHRLFVNDKKLAKLYRLSWAEDVIPGKFGEIGDMGDEGQFRLRLLAVRRNASMNKSLLARRRQALAGRLELKWKGDAESIFGFDPNDAAQTDLVLRLLSPRRKRTVKLTPEQRQAIADRLRTARAQTQVPAARVGVR